MLDLATMSWSTRRARSALDHDPANPNSDHDPNPDRDDHDPTPPLERITGASAVLAPNGAAYVFGGAESLPDPSGSGPIRLGRGGWRRGWRTSRPVGRRR